MAAVALVAGMWGCSESPFAPFGIGDTWDDPPSMYEPGGGGNNNDGNHSLSVTVPNGYCVLGAVASAIQRQTGCSDWDATRQAETALNAAGIHFDGVSPLGGGIWVDPIRIMSALNSLGFIVTLSPVGGFGSHFSNGGYAIGHINKGNGLYHDVFVTGYDTNTGAVTYYDATKGEWITERTSIGIMPFN